jgi:hypothetical protein
MKLELEGLPRVLSPTLRQLYYAVDRLTPFGGPGFLVLQREDGDYAQAAGGDGEYAVEWREWLDDKFTSFRHYRAGREGRSGLHVAIPTNGFQVTAMENERLSKEDVKGILGAFLKGLGRPHAYRWRDISDSLGAPLADDIWSRQYERRQYEAWREISPEDRLFGDPPDIPYTEHEEFELLRDIDMRPEEFADKEVGERYRSWLTKNPPPPE